MLTVDIPGKGRLELCCAVFDYNGTLADGGTPVDGAREGLTRLAKSMKVYVITADTFGTVQQELAGLPLEVVTLNEEPGGPAKEKFVRSLDARRVVAFGNGANDALMLRAAELGIVIVGPEGAAIQAVLSADIALPSAPEAIRLLLEPQRLVATLRS